MEDDNHLTLFLDEELTTKQKFYFFMDLLVSNQSHSRLEIILFFLIFYIQMISGYFSEQIGVLDKNSSTSDKILYNINKIFRIKSFLSNEKNLYEYVIYIIFVYIVFIYGISAIIYYKTDRKTEYNIYHFFINILHKINIYIFYNISLDFFSVFLCYKENPNELMKEYNCSLKEHLMPFIFSLLTINIQIFGGIYIQIFNLDSFYLSSSFYAQLSSNYWTYMLLNCVLFSFSIRLVKNITKMIFFIVNILASFALLIYYLKKIIYYDNITHLFCGLFHILFFWESVFFFIFNYINISEKGLIFILSSILVCLIFINILKKFERNLFCNTPYYEINNKYYLLYYMKKIINLIQNCNENPSNSILLTGIVKLHMLECPDEKCLTKVKKNIYLPASEEWSDRSKPFIIDKIFLNHVVIAIMEYFISKNYYNAEILINFSYYYLYIIGNVCKCIYYLEKIINIHKTPAENFTFERLKIIISKTFFEKLKPPNEPVFNLIDLNTSYYYKYNYYKNKFFNEILRDLELNQKFWKLYSKKDNKNLFDFNLIFKTTEKIMITKKNVTKLWEKIHKIYSGVNEVFDFYSDYVEQINDDTILKRNLEEFKRRNENFSDNIQLNYYNLMFKPEVGICIVSGDKGKEGEIEKINTEFCKIFKYQKDEIMKKNISIIMPKIFGIHHQKYMSNYIEIGEKKFIDKNQIGLYAIDKDNCIVNIKIVIKIFPVLNNRVLFIGIITPEKIDDLILIDENFYIQGMSKKLLEKLSFINKYLFINNDVPFYMICKNFINFYRTFMKGNKKKLEHLNSEFDEENSNESSLNSLNSNKINYKKKETNLDNIDINENIDLEYEIKIPKFMINFENFSKLCTQLKNTDDDSEGEDNQTTRTYLDDSDDNSSLIQKPQVSHKFLRKATTAKNKSNKDITFVTHDSNKNVNISFNNKITPGNTPNPNIVVSKKSFNNSSIININNNNNNNAKKNVLYDENLFLSKLEHYKKLFQNEEFDELEDLLDNDNNNSSTLIYKFNFTFKKKIYNENKMIYIIKCIDNKNEFINNESEDEDCKNDIIKNKKILKSIANKMDLIEKESEVYEEEYKKINENINFFYDIVNKDKKLNDLIKDYKIEIKKFSRIHGNEKNEVVDDENASQSSTAGFNSDLSKINRILEIRENTLNNKNNYLTVKYILSIPFIFFIMGILFCILFFYIYQNIFHNLEDLDFFHSNYYLLAIRITEIISNIISMKGIIYFQNYDNIEKFRSFIENKNEYFDYLKNLTFECFEESIVYLFNLEKNLTKYSNEIISETWSTIEVNYNIDLTTFDLESFPFSISRGLVNSFFLINHDTFHFNINIENISSDVFNEINYYLFVSIENNYDFILPYFYKILKNILIKFKNLNNGKMNQIYFLLIAYIIIFLIFAGIYLYILFLTDKHLGNGFEKLIKISQNKIDGLLEKIKNFRENSAIKNLNKRFSTEIFLKHSTIISTNIIVDQKKTNDMNSIRNSSIINNSEFSLDVHKKKLSLQNSTYIHFVLIIIINIVITLTLFLLMKKLIKLNYMILEMQAYLLGRYLVVSSSTVYVKCYIFPCDYLNVLDFQSFFNAKLAYSLFNNLNNFPQFKTYYSKYFLKDACGAAGYENDEEKYKKCLENDFVRKLNNTDAFLDLILEEVNNLIFELANNLEFYDNNSLGLFTSNNFEQLEEAYYYYIVPSLNIVDNKIREGFQDLFDNYQKYILIISSVFLFCLVVFIIYIKIFFIPTIIHMLNISKCIIRIIPTSIISENQDLENWLEKMNNDE